MRPQHLKDLLLCRESGSDFLTALTAFVNMTLAGQCPADIAPAFFSGRLIALNKKAGGIRPIAIGFTLRRLVSKCANTHAAAHLATYFKPIQLGVGIPGGCEAAVHSARRFLETMQSDNVLVKLDFSNAFNSLHRFDICFSVLPTLLHNYCFHTVAQLIQMHPFCTMVSTTSCLRRSLSRRSPRSIAFLQHHSPVTCAISH